MTKLDSIVELKAEIDAAKTELAKSEGKKEGFMNTLKKDWKCASLKKADEKATSIEDARQELIDKREESIAKLEEKYEL